MPTINSCCNITNQHNCVGADDFRPRILHKFIYIHFVGTSLAAVRYRQYPMQSFNRYNLPSTIASYYNQTFILPAFQHFLSIQKSKRLQKKSKLRAAPRDPTTPRRSIKFAASSAHSPVNSLPLKQYGLVRLASQAVQPSQLAYRALRRGYCKSDYKNQLVTYFYSAMVQVIDKSPICRCICFRTPTPVQKNHRSVSPIPQAVLSLLILIIARSCGII